MNAIQKDKKFVEEALAKITTWNSKPSPWKSFFLISQHTYRKKRNISEEELEKIFNFPSALKACLLQFGECEINSSLTLNTPQKHDKNDQYYVIGHYNRFGKIGRLLYKSHDDGKIYLELDTINNIELVSEDLRLLLAMETIG